MKFHPLPWLPLLGLLFLACKGGPDPVDPTPTLADLVGTYTGEARSLSVSFEQMSYTDTTTGQPVYWYRQQVDSSTFVTSITLRALGPDSVRFDLSPDLAAQLSPHRYDFAWQGVDSSYQYFLPCHACTDGYQLTFSPGGDTLFFVHLYLTSGPQIPQNSTRSYRFAGVK